MDQDDGLEPLFDYGREQACDSEDDPPHVNEGDRDTSWLPPPPKLTKTTSAASEVTLQPMPISSFLKAKQVELLSLSQKACKDMGELERKTMGCTTPQVILVRVQDASGTTQSVRMGMEDSLDKLFAAYSRATGTSLTNLVFRFDGEQLQPTATPRSMNLENGDIVEVFVTSGRVASEQSCNVPKAQQQRKLVLRIQDKSGAVDSFRMGEEDRFEKLFSAYALSRNVCKSTLVFCFDGEQLQGNATPKSVDMEDEDTIEAFVRS